MKRKKALNYKKLTEEPTNANDFILKNKTSTAKKLRRIIQQQQNERTGERHVIKIIIQIFDWLKDSSRDSNTHVDSESSRHWFCYLFPWSRSIR